MTNSRKDFQQQFWSKLERVFHERQLEWPKNIPDQCKDFPMGKRVTLFLGVLHKDNRLTIGLALDGDAAQENFDHLDRHRNEIEKQLDLTLIWDPKPGSKRCAITLERHVDNLDDKMTWADHHDWMATLLPRFQSVFRPHIDRM